MNLSHTELDVHTMKLEDKPAGKAKVISDQAGLQVIVINKSGRPKRRGSAIAF
jgi:hypothetical protein